MNITNAQYKKSFEETSQVIMATINGVEMFVPLDLANTDYAEIMRQVEAGELTIQPADSE